MKKRTAVDIGASRIRVLAPDMEEAAECACAIALECASGMPVAFGDRANLSEGRMPGSVDVIAPLLTPEALNASLLEGLFSEAAALTNRSGRFRTDLVLSLPGGLGDKEELFPEAAAACGARDVFVISALHAVMRSLPPSSGLRAILHVGASASEIGLYDGDLCLASRVVAVGGHTFDDLLGDYIYDRFGLLLDGNGAEDVKLRLSARTADEKTIRVSGIARQSGLPRTEALDAEDLCAVLLPAYAYLTSPMRELMSERGVMADEILLSGGSAMIWGLADALQTAIPESRVEITADPAGNVIRGLDEIMASGELDIKKKGKRA